MKILLVILIIFSWKIFWLTLGILFMIFIIRRLVFPKFFDDFFEKIEIKKEKKEKEKWQRLLKEKDFYFFIKSYHTYSPNQIKDLILKTSGVLEILRLGNLECYCWPQEINKETEKRFDEFLETLNTESLSGNIDKILKIQKELNHSVKKETVDKKLLLNRLKAKVKDLIENKFEELQKDTYSKKTDWSEFFSYCVKLYDADTPILINIGKKINEISLLAQN